MTQPLRKLDLLKECNDRGLPAKEFAGTFCLHCKNAKCINAAWGESSWTQRMGTQVERLLKHPNFADPRDTRFEGIRGLHFVEVQPAIILNPGDPWAGPGVHLAHPESEVRTPNDVDYAVAALTGKQSPTTSPSSQAPKDQTLGGAVEFPVPLEVPSKPKDPGALVEVSNQVNTEFPEEGVMVDGSEPPPNQGPQNGPTLAHDPWAPPQGNVKFVPVGAKIRMGG
jgi:hypothetical protein